MKHAYHVLLEVVLIFLLAILFFQYRKVSKEKDALEADKKRLDLELQLRSDSMSGINESQQYLTDLSDSLFNDADIRFFKGKGLKNPERALLSSLYQQQDLIPAEATLGGQMRIWYAVLLSRNWALAYFEDGHIAGNMLLEYEVKEGNIQWTLIDSSLNGQ